jgi:hypothetical protein
MRTFNWLGTQTEFKYIHGYSPKEINGDLDGIYYAMQSTTRPY